jgi:D-3-phosphoglycerate dehydrogenase / 2-oxoglutarate reductase
MQTKVVRTDRELECPQLDRALRERGMNLVLLPGEISEEELAEQVRDADLLLMCYSPITARIIDRAERLKGIVKYGVGIDAIEIEAAKARRIPVVNIPEYAEESVAEAAFALMIALAKKLVPLDRAMHDGGWVWPTPRWMASEISGKTVGLVGAGRIARNLARIVGAGFRARVLGYDPNVSAEEMHAAGVGKVSSLREMLPLCDFVSVHCTLNKMTRHLMADGELRCMKPSAILINVSRGAIVDEMALLEALREGRIAGVGLDVYSQEPLARRGHPMSPLLDMDNVVLTPHLAFYTQEAMQRLELETLERCFEILDGRPVRVKSNDPRLISQVHGVVFEV